MAIGHTMGSLIQLLKKYRFAVLIILIGILLMSLPSISDRTYERTEQSENVAIQTESTEENLERILCEINGAGNVSVMLTTATGEEIIYQVNTDSDSHSDTVETKIETVVVSDQNRNESGLVRQINPPKYLGAIIVCQGADDPKVQLAITDAVSKITGLGTNRISVLKMK